MTNNPEKITVTLIKNIPTKYGHINANRDWVVYKQDDGTLLLKYRHCCGGEGEVVLDKTQYKFEAMNTIARDIDALCICNIKIFFLENTKRDQNASDTQVAEATRKTNNLNSERNSLIDQIDQALNKIAAGDQQQLFGSNKMYGNEK